MVIGNARRLDMRGRYPPVMETMTRRRLGTAILAGLAVTALTCAVAATFSYRTALARLEGRADAALTLAIDRLESQLDQYRYLPAVMARHPAIRRSVTGPPATRDTASRMMERVADISGASDIYVMDFGGTTIASSNWMEPHSFIGQNFAWRPYFKRAIGGGLGYYHAVGTTSGQRGFYFAHPIRDDADRITGVITVKLDLERIESAWRGDAQTAFFSDANGVIFLSNRDALLLRRLPGSALDPGGADDLQYAGEVPEPMAADPETRQWGYRLWSLDLGLPGGLPALWLSRGVPTLDLTGHVLVDVAEARRQAALFGGLGAAIGALVMLVAFELVSRRNRLRTRFAQEARAKLVLEKQVNARTRELSIANDQLRAEIGERVAAEAQLRDVQEQLVQAAKLKALGEMSAGISHELNQPLAAIQTLADNAQILMDRGREDEVRGNLGSVSALAQRAGRIIRNLRAFARKEEEAGREVDLPTIVAQALELAAPRLDRAGVEVHWDRATPPVMAYGGPVRLQQVLVNLLSNAADAMADREEPRRIDISVSDLGGRATVVIEDTGPGLAAPDRIFDPFYTTKTVGEGLGLGLSISYGIVKSFGGELTGENAPGGGARFTLTLPRAREAAA